MKGTLKIFILTFMFVLAGTFSLFLFSSNSLTGNIIENGGAENVENLEEIIPPIILGTEAMKDIERYVREMGMGNFSNSYFEDSLIEAQIYFDGEEYEKVLEIQDDLKERIDLFYSVQDNLILLKISIEKYFEQGVDMEDATRKLKIANNSFMEERYEEAEILIEDLKLIIEESRSEATVLSIVSSSVKNFFVKNWYYILGALIVLFLIIRSVVLINFRVRLIKRIKKMRAEEKALNRLLIRAQKDRFKKGSISGLTYNIRIRKYKERVQEIKEVLPVLEAKSKKKLKKKKEKLVKKKSSKKSIK